MKRAEDVFTSAVYRSVGFLFMKHPFITSIGILFGLALLFLSALFGPLLARITYMDTEHAPWWGWVVLGVLIAHSKTIAHTLKRKSNRDEAVEEVLDLVRRGGFSEEERRQHYRILIEKVSRNVALNQRMEQDLRALERRGDVGKLGPARNE